MLSIEVTCAMCGREKVIHISTEGFDGNIDVKKEIRKIEWITQTNGNDFDIYCCKKCAS